jgi:hypothetical protein
LKTLGQNLSQHTLENLTTLLRLEAPINQLHNLNALSKGRGTTANLAKEGLKYLECVISAAEAMGVKVKLNKRISKLNIYILKMSFAVPNFGSAWSRSGSKLLQWFHVPTQL